MVAILLIAGVVVLGLVTSMLVERRRRNHRVSCSAAEQGGMAEIHNTAISSAEVRAIQHGAGYNQGTYDPYGSYWH